MVDQPRDDLGRFLSPDKPQSHLGFNSKFGGNLSGFLSAAEKAGHKISIYSGKRSYARQKALFDAAVAKYGSVSAARKHVAPPGKSKHNIGLAADLKYATPEAEAWAHKNAAKFGLNFRMAHEPWHIELAGLLGKLGLGFGDLLSPKPNPNLPEVMTPPQSREQALAQAAQQAAIAEAFRDPTRALDVVPSAPSPARLASQYGQYRPGTVPASMPVGLSRPAPMSQPSAPPRGAVYAGITAMDNALPSPASTMMASLASRPAPAPARPGPVTQGVRPSLAVGSLPAAPQQTTVATRPSTPAPTGLPAARAQTTVATRPTTPAPTGLPAAPGPTTAQLAEQYGAYRTPTAYTNVRNALQAVQPPAALPAAPAAPPTAPVAPVVAPAAILAPALAPPRAIQERPIAEMAPAAPRATATDVYNGLADTALDNTGQNTVGRIGNTTTVTNKYGVTTGMTPYGKQTAVGSLPSVPGSLPGIKGPNLGKFGTAVKGALPSIGGGLLGTALAGPLGGLIGAALAKAVSQPGGLLSGVNSFQTDYFGQLNAAKAQGGLGFPDAPSGGYGSGGRMGASFSNNSRSGMQGISPGAADAIGRGQGGLY